MRQRIAASAALLVIIAGVSAQTRAAQTADWAADAAFATLWQRTDGPVADGTAGRSWLWGPAPFAVANEPWAQAPGGRRLVQYFDKARMEVNDPQTDPTNPYYVTNGLIVVEMVTGQMQTGEAGFEARPLSTAPLAGDGDDPDAPTYAGFAALLHAPPSGGPPGQHIARDGTLSPFTPPGPAEGLQPAMTDAVTQHSIPAVFWGWMTGSGPVVEGGQRVQGRVFDWLATLGHPITEAYWATVKINGAPALVLVQLFERRVLTYNATNPPAFQVEMGNVGRHYFAWRYGAAAPGPAIAVDPPTGPNSPFTVRGWNWPAGPVVVGAGAAGGGFGAQLGQATADAQGAFRLPLTLSPDLADQLQRAPQSLLLTAQTPDGTAQTALPLVVRRPPPTPTPVPPTATPVPPTAPPAPPPPTPPPGEHKVIVPLAGTILSVDAGAGRLQLDVPENDPVLLQTDAATRITVGGAPAGLAALHAGQNVIVQAVRQPDAPDGTWVYLALTIDQE